MKNKTDIKLFTSLCLWALIPSVYLLIRMQIIAVNSVNIDIMGQLEWFDLIDETIVTTMTVPLYSLLKDHSKYKNGSAFAISFGLYALFTVVIALNCGHIASFMKAEYATQYLILQSFAMLIGFINTFIILLLTINSDYKSVGSITVIRLVLLALCDFLLISRFKDLGAAYSEIAVNTLLAVSLLMLAFRRDYLGLGKDCIDIKSWLKIGVWAGAQIVLANVVYAVIVVRMINAVSESGNYWVANNFIWGWLLIPVTCLAEVVKKNDLEKLDFGTTWKYCLYIIGAWVITIPGWKWFIGTTMAVDAAEILKIVYPVMPFYLFYVGSQMFEGWFISKGKTIYPAISSLVVNIAYYGIMYLLFMRNVFICNMNFIIQLFGWGMVVCCVCDYLLYRYVRIANKTKESVPEV